MLERLWKSHPWQSDMPEKPKSALGPPPSATRPPPSRLSTSCPPPSASPISGRPRFAPWRQGSAADIMPPPLDDDDLSLGDDKEQVKKDKPAPMAAAKPKHPKKKKEPKAPPPVAQAPAEVVEDENTELLAIDFDRDGDALKEAIAEDVLAMWADQGLYQDMPELRDEILKGIVDNKFQALRDEQAKVVESKQLAGMPRIASVPNLDIITEEDEEEEEESSVDSGPALEDLEASMTQEERLALHAFQVQEELEVRLRTLDTSAHECLEAEGRKGNLTESETNVAIKDVHAFNKYKLHHAVEHRVSKIFTEDHHVVAKTATKEEDRNASSSSLPVVPSEGKKKVREDLHTSFSAFDALLSKNSSRDENEEDEWTECEVTLGDPSPQDLKKLVADMDRKLGLAKADDDESFMEYTVMEETVVDVDELSDKRGNMAVDVDELSEKIEKEKEDAKSLESPRRAQKAMSRIPRPQSKRPIQRLDSAQSSYVEMTVVDDDDEPETDHARRRTDESKRDSVTTAPDVARQRAIAKEQMLLKQQSISNISGVFPSILLSNMDDDELTQITFDHTLDGANSTTQDHYHADAYLNRAAAANPRAQSTSPRNNNCGLGESSQKSEPTTQTTPMDESSYSFHERGSLESSSRDAATALAKSVAKILRVEIWSPKKKVVLSALERLAHAASQGFAQRLNIARLGGVIAICRAMQSHPTHLKIQQSGCKALAELAVDEDTQEAIAEVGGTGAVVTAMQCHPKDQQVQASACFVLASITCPRDGEGGATGMSDSDDDDEDSPSSAGGGVVQALVTAMNEHPQDSEIQAKAFGALANLCLDNQGRLQELSETGGLTAMTMALQKPWANKMDQHEAISTLSILLRSLAELGTQC